MRLRIHFTLLMLMVAYVISAQNPYLVLTFTAEDNGTYMQLDSIKVMNRTQDCDTTLLWPDTVLILGSQVGIIEPNDKGSELQVFQNYPNPVVDQTTISMYVPARDVVSIIITDVTGRIIYKSEKIFDKGHHSFRYLPGNTGISFFTASTHSEISSIRILSTPAHVGNVGFEYIGSSPSVSIHKNKNATFQENFTFSFGDTLLYIGYISYYESGILDIPETHDTLVLQFANDIPCPGTPTVTYKGQIYNTVQIFSQCWMKENINVGVMIPGTQNMEENGTIEKYCYDDSVDNCDQYGGLYKWNEIMNYISLEGCQGICPLGWHIPTDEEWKILEGAADTGDGIGDPSWDEVGMRGNDAATVLKYTSGWNFNGNGVDWYGFSGLPAGIWYAYTYSYSGIGSSGVFWTSSKNNIGDKWARSLSYESQTYRGAVGNAYGLSVRCLRNEEQISPIKLTFTAVKDTNYLQLDSVKVMNRTQKQEAIIHWPDTILVIPSDLAFNTGDELLYIGYQDTLESGIVETAVVDDTSVFQFAYNIPCPGIPTVSYEGQVYNTVQIFSQCWLKENLNVGAMIPGTQDMSENGIIEKYCYDNEPDSCIKYGGLYQWNEMMQYSNQIGSQGICPDGWHIPTDEEWKVLEGAADSQFDIGEMQWDASHKRGYDAGKALKSTTDWYNAGNGINLYGLSCLPAGYRSFDGNFQYVRDYGCWYTSNGTNATTAWRREMCYYYSQVYRHNYTTGGTDDGFSVRCIKD